ncbi:hypothetical protein D9758_009359 [Tetrapyrgos nigripes]|uniref:Uncharacterized protein n=1 Tax=Tetrapyrgos nigripes TaxID=182062 RepID=A0A8H5LPG6_9AGAR|nr:hypothetical protein D9758_009359 [Tetrapyrgos nigripes]
MVDTCLRVYDQLCNDGLMHPPLTWLKKTEFCVSSTTARVWRYLTRSASETTPLYHNCNADITLEPGRTINKKVPDGEMHNIFAGGYDVQHRRWDATPVWNYLNKKWAEDFPDHDPMAHASDIENPMIVSDSVGPFTQELQKTSNDSEVAQNLGCRHLPSRRAGVPHYGQGPIPNLRWMNPDEPIRLER